MQDKQIQTAQRVFSALATGVGIWLLWDSASLRLVTYSLWADYWEHTAALTEWMRDLLAPGNPHVADQSGSARYIPSFLVLAALGRAVDLGPIELMAINALVNYGLIVVGIYLFATSYFRNPWAPAVLFLVLLSGWGVPWIWSNLYELRSFFVTASYPSTTAFGLSLIALWITLGFMRGRLPFFASLGVLLLMSALVFVTHALTGVFAIVSCCLLALAEHEEPISLRALLIAVMGGGALLAELWPFFSVWDVILASSEELDDRTWQPFAGISGMLERARSGVWFHMFYDPRQVLVSLGPALLGIPVCGWLLVKRQHRFIVAGLVIMLLPMALNVFFQVALAHRFLLYAVFFMHLALTWLVLEAFSNWSAGRRERRVTIKQRISVFIASCALLSLAVFHSGLLMADHEGLHLDHRLQLVNKRRVLPDTMSVPELYSALTDPIPENAVVIGDGRLTWPLPTFRGKAVSLPANHENSLLLDQFDRVAAEKTFLAASTQAAKRRAIVDRYGVTHVLINTERTEAGLISWLQANTKLVIEIGPYRMHAVHAPS